MASKLVSSKRALVDSHQRLEQRVDERTRELRDAATKLDKMASTDALTGLFNRRHFNEHGRLLFETARKQDLDLACLLIDLDDFKLVNDTLGHNMGDELLCLTAVVLRLACRSDDLIARLGGDEFVLMMHVSDPAVAKHVADRLLNTFVARLPELFSAQQVPRMPSMSIGIASRKNSNAKTLEEIVAAADKALYRAKETGKNKAEVFANELLAA
jgi:hemerythrin